MSQSSKSSAAAMGISGSDGGGGPNSFRSSRMDESIGPGAGASKGGFRIGKNMEAKLFMVMKPEAISQTVRVYCLDFSAGNPRNDDGDEGELWPHWRPEMFAAGTRTSF